MQKDFEQRLPPELTNRITFRPHDIFTPQPVNAAVYFLRLILHDHSDPYAIKILQNIVPAMDEGSRIVICDIMLPSPSASPSPMLRLMHTCDLQMMTVLNSKERNYEDWVDLLAKADRRLKLVNIGKIPGLHSLIEIVMSKY